MTRTFQVVIIGVIYNTFSETIRFIESIHRCFGQEAKLILVDNSEMSPDSFFIEKIKSYDFINYIRSDKNVGYLHGANKGLQHFFETNPGYPPWIIVCNVDIIFETLLFSQKLGPYEFLPDLGVIAPAILSRKWKTDANPFLMNRISLRKLYFYRIVYSHVIFHNGFISIHYFKRLLKLVLLTLSKNRKGKVNIPGKIFAPHGSCIIFNKNYFERGGTLEPISFLFGEEMFIGETARRINLEVVYVPDLQVSHTEHSSFGNFISRRTNTYYRQSINDMIHYYYPLKPEIKTY